jgi:NADH:ubiquinone oxidoreductase subunit F (NADH-binding)
MVDDLGDAMNGASICGLGRAAPFALKTADDYFAADVAAHLRRTSAEERR